MSWKPMRGTLVAGAVAAVIIFSSNTAPAQRSSCPEFGTLFGFSVAMLIATTTIHKLVTFIRAGLIHKGRVGAWYSKRSERRLLLVVIGVLMMAENVFLDIVLWA
jgi:hypothetical protein